MAAVAPGLGWLTVALLLLTPPRGALLAAPGFDCHQARTPVDRRICSDSALAELDRALATRYERLRREISPDGAADLRANQRAWLASRATCVTGDNAGRAADCLATLYHQRDADLATLYRRAGGLVLELRHVERSFPRQRVSESNDYPWLLGAPPDRAATFNRFISFRLRPDKSLFALSGIELDKKPDGDTTFDRHYEIHRFDDRLISIEFYMFHESYFGHGWRSEFALNWDLGANRPLRIADLFQADADWHRVVSEHARAWLREESDNADAADFLDDGLDDNEGWLFNDDGAVLLLGRGERSMAGTSAEVPIPDDVLAPLLRPDAPLPRP
jgi:uncharacterized protein